MRRGLFVLVMFISSVSAFAQQRTWVASTGVDTGTCSITAPCRTLQFALSQTAAGGDIVMQNSAGYGSNLVINKAVNIYGPDGVFGSLTLTSASATAIQVAAGASDVVRIKGVNILGLDPTMGQGVEVDLCGRTELQNMNIYHVGVGVKVNQDVHVTINGLTISDTTAGIWSRGTNTAATNSGCATPPYICFSPPLRVLVVNTQIIGCNVGAQVDAGSFLMDGTTNKISFAHVDQYLIAAIVPSCSSIGNWNGQMNNYTGIYNATCMCYLEDLRNGMTTIGNCRAD